MTFRRSDEEREIVVRTLKARLDALHTELTRPTARSSISGGTKGKTQSPRRRST